MAGSSSNWFKLSSGPMKGQRVFVSNATLAHEFKAGGAISKDTPDSQAAKIAKAHVAKQVKSATTVNHPLAENPSLDSFLKGMAGKSTQPAGQAKPKAPARAEQAAFNLDAPAPARRDRRPPQSTTGPKITDGDSAHAAAIGAGYNAAGANIIRIAVNKGLVKPGDAADLIKLGQAVLTVDGADKPLGSVHAAEAFGYRTLKTLKALASGRTVEDGPSYKGIQERAKEVLAAYQAGVGPIYTKVAEGGTMTPAERKKVFKYAGFANESEVQADMTKAKAVFEDRKKIVAGLESPADHLVKVKGGYAVKGLNGQPVGDPIKSKKDATTEARSYYDNLFTSNSVLYKKARSRVNKLPRSIAQAYFSALQG